MSPASTVTCPECGTENRPSRFFCASCGAYLKNDEDTLESPAVGAAPPGRPAQTEPDRRSTPETQTASRERKDSQGGTVSGQEPASPRRTGSRGGGAPDEQGHGSDSSPAPQPAAGGAEPPPRRRRGTALAALFAFLAAVGIAAALVTAALNSSPSPASSENEAATETAAQDGSEEVSDVEAESPPETEAPPRSTTTTVFAGPVEQVDVDSISASSFLEPTEDNDYHPRNMLDGDLATAWNEGAEGVGEGEWFRLNLEEPTRVRHLEIANGYQKDTERYLGNGRIAEMRITLSDGTTQTAVLEDEQGYQTVPLEGRLTEWVKITVTDAYYGGLWEDLAVSEIRVFGSDE